LDISASGLAAQRAGVEMLTQNIANAETTRTPEGGPYRRRRVVFEAAPAQPSFADMLRRAGSPAEPLTRSAERGVRVSRVVTDQSAPEQRYLPDHPDADEQGYVAFPSFNPVEDMVDLTASVRSYQANLAAIQAVKDMITATIDIVR
jgi:flagellar basal-body rod protein FlgC